MRSLILFCFVCLLYAANTNCQNPTCLSEQTRSCPCAGTAAPGSQTCQANGAGWGQCQCQGSLADGGLIGDQTTTIDENKGTMDTSSTIETPNESRADALQQPIIVNVQTDPTKNVDGIIQLTWELPVAQTSRVKAFQLYRASSPNDTPTRPIATIPVNGNDKTQSTTTRLVYVFVDTNVIIGSRYDIPFTYYLKVVAPDGTVGEPGKQVTSKTTNFSPPSEVKGVSITNQANTPRITISWDANQDYDIQGYYVFRNERDEPIQAIDPTNAVSVLIKHTPNTTIEWTDQGVQRGKTYWYVVVAIDHGNILGKQTPGTRYKGVVP